MRLLLHICCAPCTIYPLQTLRNEGFQVSGYFYNPNIHPFREYQKRKDTLRDYSEIGKLEIFYEDQCDLELFLDRTRPWGPERCRSCYEIRLEATARRARTQGFEAFSTTLLYSRYQKHDWIREVGTRIGECLAIPFYYQDFRPGWFEGVQKSKELGLYRQPYCGCIFSEKERFMKKGDRVS
ncbi:MAG: epoxyqueuosine reductase QueH [Deltaproteobacteria bacterium]|nr:epoxyqueuosine reductase QueH [Deltaproteobacteria bacterium]